MHSILVKDNQIKMHLNKNAYCDQRANFEKGLFLGVALTFIASAPQDENTGNLLTYLSDLEKDVNGKRYGLVFEEHREEIDEVLDTHTPVLTEDKELFIDNGGEMNFLIEGDNLASLQVLESIWS